jgi:hypothetical protein
VPLTLTSDVYVGGRPGEDTVSGVVLGWPVPGQTIIVRKCGQDNEADAAGRWRISRDNCRTWQGDFESKEAAVAALEAELS